MNQYDVIIVGAGICGLTVAIELGQKGKRVLILEAEEEAGGRTKSIGLSNGVCFDMGGHWFHGGDKNPFYQWAKARYDLGPLNEDTAEEDKRLMLNGEDVSDRYEVLFEQFERAYRERGDKDSSMAGVAAQTGSDEIANLAEFWSTLWMAADGANDVAARDFFDDPLGVGGWQMELGLSHLIARMVAEAQSMGAVIKYNEIVIGVKKEEGGMRAITRDGGLFTSSNIIVTASIGVLKSDMIIFDDDVAQILRQKLQGMNMGNFFKIAVPMKDDYFKSGASKNFPVGVLDPDKPCFIHAHTAGKPVITVFTGGKKAAAMELWNTQSLRDFAFDAIDRSNCFKNFRESVAGDIVSTLWSNHPYYCGAYAVQKPHHEKSDLIVCGNLVFAGEALLSDAADSPGQMAGAWRAGQRAAKLML